MYSRVETPGAQEEKMYRNRNARAVYSPGVPDIVCGREK